MGSACTSLYDHVKPVEAAARSNTVRKPNYELPPVVEYTDLLTDARGNVPRARQMHTLLPIGSSNLLLCYGGFCASISTDDPTIDALPREGAGLVAQPSMYNILDNRWSVVLGPNMEQPIPARALHAAAVVGDSMYVIGAHHKKDASLHVMTIDGSWYTLPTITTTGSSSSSMDGLIGHTMTACGNTLIVFGGESSKGISNKMFVLNVEGISSGLRHISAARAAAASPGQGILRSNTSSSAKSDVQPTPLPGFVSTDSRSTPTIPSDALNSCPPPPPVAAWVEVSFTMCAATKALVKELSRRDHSAVMFRQRLLVYGGMSAASDSMQFIQFDLVSRSWSVVPGGSGNGETHARDDDSAIIPTPPPRRGHACALHYHYMIIFGGVHRGDYMNDLWVFDVFAGFWTHVSLSYQMAPMPRAFMGSCVSGVFWYLHGGGNERCLLRTMVRFDVNEIARFADDTFMVPDARWNEEEAHVQEVAHCARRKASLDGNLGKHYEFEATQKQLPPWIKHDELVKLWNEFSLNRLPHLEETSA